MAKVNTRLGSHCTRNVLTKSVAVLRMFKDTEVTLRAGTLYVVRRVTFDSEDRRAS